MDVFPGSGQTQATGTTGLICRLSTRPARCAMCWTFFLQVYYGRRTCRQHLAPKGSLDGGDIDLFHGHHRVKRPPGRHPIRIAYCGCERAGRDLP
jgi:hypothetical protein